MKTERSPFFQIATLSLFSLLVLTTISCSEQTTLKEKFQDDFKIGVTLGAREIIGKDSLGLKLVTEQFDAVTTDNDMKWQRIHPYPGVFNFKIADKFIEYGNENGMYLVGHTLIWHSQTPDWVFQDSLGEPASREDMILRMEDHITTIVTHYKGKIDCWDVVNEAVNDDGTIRENVWYNAIGEDYIQLAFEFARKADPDAYLNYNDYSLARPEKRDGVIKLVKSLQEKGIQVDGIGMQGHYDLEGPDIEAIEASIVAFSKLGVRVNITELDISVLPSPWGRIGADISISKKLREELNPYTEMLPDSIQLELANRYKELFNVFVKHSDKIDRVTFWGVTDKTSWKNNFPMRGRTDYPLLFDRNYQAKPAFDAVMEVVN
ncbi:MAG: endo-1,4-beta-xylanase [Bacteroidales bacterium]|nr:endo-1,4-beta-xylanase [Bacteroidales bacterium]